MKRLDGQGRLAVLLPGLGAVSTTLIAGAEMHRRGKDVLVGSLTQRGFLDEGPDRNGRGRRIADALPLADPAEIGFAGWDIQPDDAYAVAKRSAVLSPEHLAELKTALERIKPRPGIYDPQFVRRLEGTHVISARSHREKIDVVRRDIGEMIASLGADRAVMVFCASTEAHDERRDVVRSLQTFERALDRNDPAISPTMLYAYAAIKEGVPFANATPNVAIDTIAFQELAFDMGVPIVGKDLKSGQTMLKTVIAPALKARMLGLRGWFSTNILGNRDGQVLDDPEAFRSKELTKRAVLEAILEPDRFPDLYGDISHNVAIHYYPPRGDEKEGWDNIDLFGWMHYPMQIKVNFLCRDSILAAPLVLDIALLLDLARRRQYRGLQEWLGFYFKSPVTAEGHRVEHDLFAQLSVLMATLRSVAQETRDAKPESGFVQPHASIRQTGP